MQDNELAIADSPSSPAVEEESAVLPGDLSLRFIESSDSDTDVDGNSLGDPAGLPSRSVFLEMGARESILSPKSDRGQSSRPSSNRRSGKNSSRFSFRESQQSVESKAIHQKISPITVNSTNEKASQRLSGERLEAALSSSKGKQTPFDSPSSFGSPVLSSSFLQSPNAIAQNEQSFQKTTFSDTLSPSALSGSKEHWTALRRRYEERIHKLMEENARIQGVHKHFVRLLREKHEREKEAIRIDYEEKLHILKSEVTRVTRAKEEAQEENSDLRGSYRIAERKLKECQDDLDEAKSALFVETNKLQREIEEREAERQMLRRQLKNAEAQSKEAEGRGQMEERTIHRLEEALNKAEKEGRELKTERNRLSDNLRELRETSKKLKKDYNVLETQNLTLNENLSSVKERLERELDLKSELETKIEQSRLELITRDKKIEKLIVEVETLEAEVEGFQKRRHTGVQEGSPTYCDSEKWFGNTGAELKKMKSSPLEKSSVRNFFNFEEDSSAKPLGIRRNIRQNEARSPREAGQRSRTVFSPRQARNEYSGHETYEQPPKKKQTNAREKPEQKEFDDFVFGDSDEEEADMNSKRSPIGQRGERQREAKSPGSESKEQRLLRRLANLPHPGFDGDAEEETRRTGEEKRMQLVNQRVEQRSKIRAIEEELQVMRERLLKLQLKRTETASEITKIEGMIQPRPADKRKLHALELSLIVLDKEIGSLKRSVREMEQTLDTVV